MTAPHPLAALRRRTVALTGAVLLGLTGCSSPAPGEGADIEQQPVDYLAVFAAQEDTLRALRYISPAPADETQVDAAVGWDETSPFDTLAYTTSPAETRVCTVETATSRYVLRTVTASEVRLYFSPDGCVQRAADAEAAIVIPDDTAPEVLTGEDRVATVITYLAELPQLDADTGAVADAVGQVAKELRRAERSGTLPGVAAEELAATLDLTLPAGTYVATYLPTGAAAQVCVAATASGAWARYDTAAGRVVASGTVGATC